MCISISSCLYLPLNIVDYIFIRNINLISDLMEKNNKTSLEVISKASIIIFIGMILGTLVGLVNQIIFARILGPDLYGIFNLATSIISIFTAFCTFGIVGSLPRFIPYYLGKNDENTVSSIIKFSLKFTLLTSLLSGVILALLSPNMASFFQKELLSTVLILFGLTLPILVLPNILESIIRGFKASEYKIYIFEIGLRIVTLLIFVLFIWIGNFFYGYMAAYIGGYLAVTILALITIHKKLLPFLSKKYETINIKKELLIFSLPLALSSLSYLFISKTDTIILGYFAPSSAVGIYTVAITVSSILYFIWYAFTWIFLPVISESFSKEDHDETASLFNSTSKWIFLIILPILILIILLSDDILTLLFGTKYSSAAIPLIILSLGISTNMLTGLTGNMLIGKGKTRLNLFSEIIGGITNLALNIYLIPLYGIIGAAAGTSMSYLTRNAASTYFVHRSMKIHPFKLEYIKIVIIAIFLFIPLFLVKDALFSVIGNIFGIILVSSVVLASYSILIHKTNCLDDNDYHILNHVLLILRSMVKI